MTEDEALSRWIASATGGEVLRLERAVGGSSRETWLADVRRDGAPLELIVRRDTGGGPLSGTELSLQREAAVYRALQGTPVPLPRVHAVTPPGDPVLGDAVLLDRMPGRNDFPLIANRAEKEAVAGHFMEILAALHSLDVAGIDLPAQRPATPEEHALADLDVWERIFRERVTRREPLVRFALGWLRRNAPKAVQRTVVVQGDTGPGNFLFDGGRVTAVLDWEFAHFGDPMDDIAWVLMRDHIIGFGDMGPLLRRYSDLSGIEIDPVNVLYYLAMVNARCAIATMVALEASSRSMVAADYLRSIHIFTRLLCQAIGELIGTPLPPTTLPEPDPPTARSPLYEIVLGDVTQAVIPALADPVAVRRAHGATAILLHLQAADRLGGPIEEAELADMAAVLGRRPPSIADGLAVLDELVQVPDPSREPELLAYLSRRADRAAALWAPALGPLATKRLAPVPIP